MAYTIYEFSDVTPGNDDPVYPEKRRRTDAALDSFVRVADVGLIRGILIYNQSGTAGMHVRVTGATAVANKADQGDTYIGPDTTGYFLIHRKDRTKDDDAIYVYATADT